MTEKNDQARRSTVRLMALLTACALMAGVVCTTLFFLVGPGRQMAQDPVPGTARPEQGGAATQDGTTASDGEATGGDVSFASPEDTRAILASWDRDSVAYQQLTSFVEDVCDPASAGYVPPEERVATFDMDGTFLCERGPIYIDQTFAAWHVLYDPDFDAPPELRAAAESALDDVESGVVPEDVNLNAVLAQSYAGRSPDELEADVIRFASTADVVGFSGMTYSESFYLPMVEVIEYLRANGFEVYVVTACERYVSRALAVEYVGFDPTYVIGTDLLTAASGQGGEEGLDYTFDQGDTLVIAGSQLLETGRTNKVIAIENEIGRRPILAFGNSSGDFAMLNYVTANPDHPALGFLVLADDTVREYGDEGRAASMREEAEAAGWVAISMRDDWLTIYGPGVEKTDLNGSEELADAA